MRFLRAVTSAAVAALTLPLLTTAAPADATKSPTPADVHGFVAGMNTEYKARYLEPNAAEWVAETYITDDTQALTARANERWLQWLSTEIDQSRAYENVTGT